MSVVAIYSVASTFDGFDSILSKTNIDCHLDLLVLRSVVCEQQRRLAILYSTFLVPTHPNSNFDNYWLRANQRCTPVWSLRHCHKVDIINFRRNDIVLKPFWFNRLAFTQIWLFLNENVVLSASPHLPSVVCMAIVVVVITSHNVFCHCCVSCAINTRSHHIMTKVFFFFFFVHKNRNQMNGEHTHTTMERTRNDVAFGVSMFVVRVRFCVCHWPMLITVSFISFIQQMLLCINKRLTHVHVVLVSVLGLMFCSRFSFSLIHPVAIA